MSYNDDHWRRQQEEQRRRDEQRREEQRREDQRREEQRREDQRRQDEQRREDQRREEQRRQDEQRRDEQRREEQRRQDEERRRREEDLRRQHYDRKDAEKRDFYDRKDEQKKAFYDKRDDDLAADRLQAQRAAQWAQQNARDEDLAQQRANRQARGLAHHGAPSENAPYGESATHRRETSGDPGYTSAGAAAFAGAARGRSSSLADGAARSGVPRSRSRNWLQFVALVVIAGAVAYAVLGPQILPRSRPTPSGPSFVDPMPITKLTAAVARGIALEENTSPSDQYRLGLALLYGREGLNTSPCLAGHFLRQVAENPATRQKRFRVLADSARFVLDTVPAKERACQVVVLSRKAGVPLAKALAVKGRPDEVRHAFGSLK